MKHVQTTPVGLVAAQLLALSQTTGTGLIHVTSDEPRARQIGAFLKAAAPEAKILVFPPWDCLPYDQVSPSRDVMGQRMATLRELADLGAQKVIVVTTPHAAMQRVPPKSALRSFEIRVGEALDPERLRRFCRATGYIIDERVDEPGEAAFRGEAIDIFPAGRSSPFRLEMQKSRVVAIRSYDALSQRTETEAHSLLLDPASELPPAQGMDHDPGPGAEHWLSAAYPHLETLFQYLPQARLVEEHGAGDRRQSVLALISEAYEDRLRRQGAELDTGGMLLAPDKLYLGEAEWRKIAGERGAQFPPRAKVQPVP